MRLIDLDDDRHCYVGNDGEYERWNIYPDASTIDPMKHGKWEVTPWYIKCSECGESFMLIPQNYCPTCGAYMRGEVNKDEYDKP